MSAADPATLAAIQRITKRCLAEIDRVCTLLDIRYVAYGGTAIGAVRHRGFIPWDDDGDVCMPRADYERFIAEAPAVLGKEFFIASPASHSDFPISFGVLGLKGSEFISTVAKDRSFRMPIGVDLFVLDEIADSPSSPASPGARGCGPGSCSFVQFRARRRVCRRLLVSSRPSRWPAPTGGCARCA